ncbi:MAG: type II toxin-antitoxin system VapC family toxin [Tannerella sp.]|jgi:predicted nucleic acid-binding protein|nr:type II toxin-antitoxin system VapC family toxin [Tannerella sp.]
MGQKYLIDSNVLIDYMAAIIPVKGSDFVENMFDTQFLISVVTKIEVLGYNDLPHKMTALRNFVSLSEILPLNETVTEKTIELKRSFRKMKLGDAIIAATALVDNLILITRNVDDFKFIPSLAVLNPYEM